MDAVVLIAGHRPSPIAAFPYVAGVKACAALEAGRRCKRETEFPCEPTRPPTQLAVANRISEVIVFYRPDPSGTRVRYAALRPAAA